MCLAVPLRLVGEGTSLKMEFKIVVYVVSVL